MQELQETLIARVVHSYLMLRVEFNSRMYVIDNELMNINNYFIRGNNIDTRIDVLNVLIKKDVSYPKYVDLVVSDCIQGEPYVLAIVSNKIRSITSIGSPGKYICEPRNTYEFIGVTILPEIISVKALSSTKVRITFSKAMRQNDELLNPRMYHFTNELQVLRVQLENESSVILTTSPQFQAQIYELTIGNVK